MLQIPANKKSQYEMKNRSIPLFWSAAFFYGKQNFRYLFLFVENIKKFRVNLGKTLDFFGYMC